MNKELFPVTPLFPKIQVYKNNGTGRDAYIAFNNGGFASKILEENEMNKCNEMNSSQQDGRKALRHGHFYKLAEKYNIINCISLVSNRSAKSVTSSLKARNLVENNVQIKHYFSDGTGRDRYIVCDEGGFSNPVNIGLTVAQSQFERNLRTYNRPMPVSDDDYFLRAQLRRRRFNNLEIDMFKSQKELDSKLSSPKYFSSPKITLPRISEGNGIISRSVSQIKGVKTEPY